jgi:hypothetical protein
VPVSLIGASTMQKRQKFNFDFFDIEFSRAKISGFDLHAMTVTWYDGCNWHTASLLLIVIAFYLIVGGLVLIGVPMVRQNE